MLYWAYETCYQNLNHCRAIQTSCWQLQKYKKQYWCVSGRCPSFSVRGLFGCAMQQQGKQKFWQRCILCCRSREVVPEWWGLLQPICSSSTRPRSYSASQCCSEAEPLYKPFPFLPSSSTLVMDQESLDVKRQPCTGSHPWRERGCWSSSCHVMWLVGSAWGPGAPGAGSVPARASRYQKNLVGPREVLSSWDA